MDIDIVILWVDGADPGWQEQKRKYLPPAAKDGDSVNRYRDWGLLPYWFRSIEKFAPWVRKIHFVTWGHVPGWLDLEAPKLNVVPHEDFIPGEYLPTFSSHAIEMNIHRIPDLAEHFIYFNDDMFLLRPMKESDFFRDGLPCACGIEVPWEFRGAVGIWEHAVANNMGVINAHFSKRKSFASHGRKYMAPCYRWQDNVRTLALRILYPDYFTGFRNLHTPAPYLKETFQQVWEAEPELLDITCREKFRAASGVNQWVCLWWQVASGNFVPYVTDILVQPITGCIINQICHTIENGGHDIICLNDPDWQVDYDVLAERLIGSFEKLLPQKSGFEKWKRDESQF